MAQTQQAAENEGSLPLAGSAVDPSAQDSPQGLGGTPAEPAHIIMSIIGSVITGSYIPYGPIDRLAIAVFSHRKRFDIFHVTSMSGMISHQLLLYIWLYRNTNPLL